MWKFGLIIGHQIHKRIMKENTLLLRVLCIMKGFSWIVFLIEWKITPFSKTTSRFLQCVVLSTALYCLKPSKVFMPPTKILSNYQCPKWNLYNGLPQSYSSRLFRQSLKPLHSAAKSMQSPLPQSNSSSWQAVTHK